MKTLETRISQKHDFEAKWLSIGDTFKPYNGEIIVYDAECDEDGNVFDGATLPDGRAEYISYPRIKIGDDIRTVNELPFASNGESGFNSSDEFIFYCGDSTNLSDDPYATAEYIVACGDATSLN